MKKSDNKENIKLSYLHNIVNRSGFDGICYLFDKEHGLTYIHGEKADIFASICCLVNDLSNILDVTPDDVLNLIRIGFKN